MANTNFAKLLLERKDWQWSYDKVFVKPNIPTKKLLNGLSYAPNVDPDDVLILVDDTVFGGAKDGMLVTSEAVYCHEIMTPMKRVPFTELNDIGMAKKCQVLINGEQFFKGQVVDHLALLTITSRLKKVLHELQAEHAPESPVEDKPAPQANPEPPTQKQRQNAPKAAPDVLKFVARDEYYNTIAKLNNINKASSVASFFLGDANKDKPVSKIVEDFTNRAYKSVMLFRKTVIEEAGLVKLANDICTVEVACYSVAKMFSQLSEHSVPDTVLTAVQRKAIPDVLFIKANDNVNPFMRVISDYIKGLQTDEAQIELVARIFITNQEQKFVADMQSYGHHIVDEQGQGFTQPFTDFTTLIERALAQFESQHDRLVAAHVSDVLDIIHNN